MDGRGLASGASPIHVSPTRSPVPCRPFTTVGVGKSSVPTSPTYSKQAWPTLKKRSMGESTLAPFLAYASPSSSAIDHWKKLARKAELELHLEVDTHRADNAKNNATIHRINRRLIPLEKALGKAKEALKQQEKFINYLKCQLMAANEKKNMEISYLRSQNETFQKKLEGACQTNEQKISELQEGLHQAGSRAETLEAQINEIYKNVDDETDTLDGSGTRAGSPASPASSKDGVGSFKSAQRQNKQNIGLSAVAKIHRMRLFKQHLKEKLKESEEEILLLVQENDRLRKLAQEAVGRSNKFLDLAQTLKADRDLTMSRLKETEGIIKSLEALKDFVHAYLKTTSPRLTQALPGPHFHKLVPKKQETVVINKTSDGGLQIETADLATMKTDCHTKVIYLEDDFGKGHQTIGESLLKKLQDVFQVLAYKVETANQTANIVKKEGEKVRLTMLEAFQELRGQKGSKLNTADDVALGVLIAVRDVKHTLEDLEKERAHLKASESMEDEKFMLLQTQVHELSMDKLALLESLELVKNAVRGANAGHGVIQYMKGFVNRRVVQGENISDVLEMIGKLISERNEARSKGGGLMEDKLLKEKELSDLITLYAQSQTLTTHLQVEKDDLKKQRNELKAICEDFKRQKASWDTEKKGENDKKILEMKSQIHELVLDRAALLETLEAIKNALASSRTGCGDMQHVKGFLKRSLVQGVNVSEVVDMVEELVMNNEEARLKESHLMEERETRERELGHINSVCLNLEEEKKSLQNKFIELQQSARALKTEKESVNASSAVMEKQVVHLQTQLHEVTQELAASQGTLKTLKHTFRAGESSAGERSQDYHLPSLEGKNGSELVEMAEQLLKERNENRSRGRKCEEDLEMKVKELSELRHLYTESKSFRDNLQNEKDELGKEVTKLRHTFRTIEGSISGGSGPGLETSGSSPLTLENMVTEVVVIKEKLNAANSELARDRRVFERIFEETKSKAFTDDHPPSDWESEASGLISSMKNLQAEKQQLSAVATACTELHCVLIEELKKLLGIMIPAEVNPNSSMENTSELTVQDHIRANSTFRRVISSLPSVIDEVGKLKRRQKKLEKDFQSLELEKEEAVRRGSEHLVKIRELSDGSQQEFNELREQLSSVHSLVSSVSMGREQQQHVSSHNISSNQDIQKLSVLSEVEGIIRELVSLRAEKAHLEGTVGELQAKGNSEQDRVNDLAMKLSSAEVQVQTMSRSALAADSKLQTLESQHTAAQAQLSELFRVILSKEHAQSSTGMSSSSEEQTANMEIGEIIKAVKKKVLQLLVGREEEVRKKEKEGNKWKGQQEDLERNLKLSITEVERLKEKLNGQAEFVKKHTAQWTRLVESLKSEISRLGGSDLRDEGEKLRKSLASEKVKEILLTALARSPSTSATQASTDASPPGNPLNCLATFQVDLLVNSKVHSQLKVSGPNGGLCQAVLHYFFVDGKTGEITFENATVPGSQSSNLVVDLFMQPVDSKKGYQTQAGDVLGLRVKLLAVSDSSPREVLNNTSIMRCDEVLDAIQGQMIQNFSLWPDILSSWRWERDAKKNRWSLMCVRWRFLLKNIFPDLSAPLQDLSIRTASAARSSSIHIM